MEKINKTESCFFEKINKIDKTLARLILKTQRRLEIRNERGDVTIDTTEIQRIVRDYERFN